MSEEKIFTVPELEEMGLMQITVWSLPDERFNTEYGKISVLEWLQQEEERIIALVGRKAAIGTLNNYLALFVNRVAS